MSDGTDNRFPEDSEAERFRQLLVSGPRSKSTGRWYQGIMREKNSHQQYNVPHPHQVTAVKEMMGKGMKFFGLYHDMGLGKTVTVCIAIAARYNMLGKVPKVLIACPAGLIGHWKKNLHDWLRVYDEETDQEIINMLFVRTGADMTHSALNKADVVVVSRELLAQAFGECYHKEERHHQEQTTHGMRWVSAWVRTPNAPLHPLYGCGYRTEIDADGVQSRVEVNREFHMFIADEAHDLRNPSSKRTQAFREMSRRCMKRIGATGTPVLNRTGDIASQCLALGAPTEPIDFTKSASWVHRGDHTVLNARTNEAFAKYVNRATEDMLDLPPMVHTAISYDVGVPEEKVEDYNANLEKARMIKAAFDSSSANPSKDDIARLMAVLQRMQFMAVCPTIAEYGADEIHRNKELVEEAALHATGAFTTLLAELRQLQSEKHMRIVVSSMHTSILHVAAKFLAREAIDLGKQYFFDGNMSQKKRDQAVHEFLSCRVGVMFLSIAAGGQGLHLVPGCEAMVLFGSTPWSNATVDQVCKRIHRMGQKCPVTGSVQIRRLVPYGSVDAAISAVHGCKRRLQKMTVDSWATETAVRVAKKRKAQPVDADDDGDDDEDLQAKWRRTGKIVDLCHDLKESGNFAEMPLMSTNADGEETGVYTVIPGIQTRGREGELPPDPTPVPDVPIAPVAPVAPNHNLQPPDLQELLGPGVPIPPMLQQMIDAAQGPVAVDADLGE